MRCLSSGLPALTLCFIFGVMAGEAGAQAASGESRPSGELAVSEESMQLRYVTPAARAGVGTGELGFGLFLNEERDIVASSNLYIEATQLAFRNMTILVGPAAYAALLSTENDDVFAIALGAEVRYRLLRNPEVTAVGRAAYAPDILTFGSADNLWDLIARLELPITDRVTGFGGYRLFEIDLLSGKTELEESIHLGLRYRF